MFTIIGGDGNEYGPVTVDQVREWLASGRANRDTQAKRAGEDQWKRLGDFPEFATATSGGTPPSGTAHVDPKAIADDLISRAAPLDIGGCLDRSWQLLKAHVWPLVGATFFVVAAEIVAFAIPVPLVGPLVGWLLGGVFFGGLLNYYLKTARGQPVDFGDAFAGFTVALVPLMLASLLVNLFTFLGFFLIIPGIYLLVAYFFTYLLIIDQKLDFWPAMEVSRRVITSQWWRAFALLLLGLIIMQLGLVAFIVGVFFTLPIAIGALVYAYEDLCRPPPRVA